MISLRLCSLLFIAIPFTAFISISYANNVKQASNRHVLPELVYRWLHWGANWRHPHPSAVHPEDEKSSLFLFSKPSKPTARYVTGAATRNSSFTAHLPYPSIMMHRTEVDLIASYLTTDDIYLQFGSSGSDIAFPPLVKRAYVIEHNCKVATIMRQYLYNRKVDRKEGNVVINCVDIQPGFRGWGTISPFEHANYEQFREYVDRIDSLPETRFDKVLIDGRARLACALRVLPYLHNESLVFVHDFYANVDHYSPIMQYYTEVSRVLAHRNRNPIQGPIDEPQGLIVLRRKPHIAAPISRQQIDSLYKSIDWRKPFHSPLTHLGSRIMYNIGLFFDWGRWKYAHSPQELLTFVRYDWLVIAVLYGISSFLLRNYRTFATKPDRKHRDPPIATQESKLSAAQPATNIRYVETEGMKPSNSRRKLAGATVLNM